MEKSNFMSQCCNDPSGATAEQIGAMMDKNQREAIVMTGTEFVQYLQDKAGNNLELLNSLKTTLSQSSFKNYWNETLAPNIGDPAVVPTAQLVSDAAIIAKTLYLVGITTRCYTKGEYIIITGYSGLRKTLTGTRYLASNPKIIEIGFGLKGLLQQAKGGFQLALVVSSLVETVDWFFKDEKTMVDLFGGIGVEAIKCGIASCVGYALGAGIASLIGLASVPLIGLAIISCGIAIGLNYLDNRYNVKQQVVAALKSLPDNLEKGLYIVRSAIETDWKAELEREIRQFEDWLIRAAEQQAKAFLQKAVMNLFRHRLFRIGLS